MLGRWVDLPAATIVLGRTGFAAACLLLLALLKRQWLRPSRRLVVNGIVLAVHWLTFFQAIRMSSVAIGLLGYASFPLFVLLLEQGIDHARFTRKRVAVAALVVIGLALLAPVASVEATFAEGLSWGIASGFTFALLAVRNRRFMTSDGAVRMAFWQILVAGLSVAPLALVRSVPLGARDLVLLAILGLACTALAHTLFVWTLRSLSAHTASTIAALEPVYGIGLALALLNEVPSMQTVLGGTLIVAGAMLASSE